jgi:hypothetical protein
MAAVRIWLLALLSEQVLDEFEDSLSDARAAWQRHETARGVAVRAAALAAARTVLAAATFPVGHDCTISYELAPMTWKDELTKMWWGQLTPM